MHEKLRSEDLCYFDTTLSNSEKIKWKEYYRKFINKLKNKKEKNVVDPNGHHKPFNKDTYPQRKRFNIFVDQRKGKSKATTTFFEVRYI